MKPIITSIFFIWICCFSGRLNAQTVNVGTVYISSGTQLSTVGALDNQTTGDFVNDGELFVYNNYNNDGVISFTTGATTGTTRFRGLTGFQDISGSMPVEWYNVEFNNNKIQPAFHLSNEVKVFNTADFKQGIINEDDYGGTFVFNQNGVHTNTSNQSHVDGNVVKNGSPAFLYPIGDKGFFRYSAMSAPGNNSSSFSGKYFFEDPNPLYSLAKKAVTIDIIDDKEYWILNKVAGTPDVLLTLSWDDATTPAAVTAQPQEDIHIVRWDNTQQLWIDEGGIVDNSNKTVTTIISVLGYGPFTLARVKDISDGDIVVHNAISPNGDGINDYFKIDNIKKYPNNNVIIYNRWGIRVFETTAYDSNGNVFSGLSSGRSTVKQSDLLPTGTYFYTVEYQYDKTGVSSTIKKSGYLYINNQ